MMTATRVTVVEWLVPAVEFRGRPWAVANPHKRPAAHAAHEIRKTALLEDQSA